MKRKVIGILAAVVLASVGTFVLVGYVQSAKEKAEAGEPLTAVYVLERDITANTPISTLDDAVALREIPTSVVVEGAVTDLDDLDDDLVSSIGMRAGEQLLTSRLVAADTLVRGDVPEGLQELTIALDPERAVGGSIAAGDTVGVVISFDPFDAEVVGVDGDVNLAGLDGADADVADSVPDSGPKKTPNTTHLTLHNVLVTAVQYDQREIATSSVDDETDDADPIAEAPSNALLVTIALPSAHVEQVVFAAEFGHIWLTGQNASTKTDGTRIVTLGEAYAAQEVQP